MDIDQAEIYSNDLPTRPLNDGRLILVTGANGYIGGRLIPELIVSGYNVRIMVRHDFTHYKEKWPQVEVVVGDALNVDSLDIALKGVPTAFYLIHSLGLGHKI